MASHPIAVKILQSGSQWLIDQQTNIAIHRAMLHWSCSAANVAFNRSSLTAQLPSTSMVKNTRLECFYKLLVDSTVGLSRGPRHDDIRAVCLVTPCGCLESNYVQLCSRKTLVGHFSPCHITVLSGISSLPREKHRWRIGPDVFRTKWAMNILAWPLARVHIPEREKCMSPLQSFSLFPTASLCEAVKYSI